MKLKELFEAKGTDKQHIQRYTDLSRPLSRALYKHNIEGTEPPETIDGHHIPSLDRITTKSALSKNITVYTGIRHNPESIMDNNIIHFPVYVSTSEYESVAAKFAIRQARRKDDMEKNHIEPAHILAIHVKKGQHAVDISGKSLEQHEKERLLPRGTTVKVLDNPEIYDIEGRPVYVWDCLIISQNNQVS
jgi:hypothetical protein